MEPQLTRFNEPEHKPRRNEEHSLQGVLLLDPRLCRRTKEYFIQLLPQSKAEEGAREEGALVLNKDGTL